MSSTASGFAQKATVQRAKSRIVLSGPTKSGKTFVALVIATELLKTLKEYNSLKGNGRIIVIDSENGRSADQYGDIFDFDMHDLYDFSPETYIDALDKSVEYKYSLTIVDQISHEWAGKNGALELKNNAQANSGGRLNDWTAWNPITPRHNKFIESLVRHQNHLICTMRSKMDHVQEKDETGRSIVRRIGLQPIQRDTTPYEFDVEGELTQDSILSIKTRGSLSRLIGNRVFMPGCDVDHPGDVLEIGRLIGKWIAGRASAEELGIISREQVDEIQTYGDRLGWGNGMWKKFLDQFGISSVSRMTPEMYDIEKKKLLDAIAQKEAKARLLEEKQSNPNHQV